MRFELGVSWEFSEQCRALLLIMSYPGVGVEINPLFSLWAGMDTPTASI